METAAAAMDGAAAAAVGIAPRKRKGSLSEDHVSVILQRYSASAILTLLQEVAQFGGAKIDWHSIVKKTSTGISSAREYQMLWRHLAYRHELIEKVDSSAEPVDDDSDLEFELEAVPPANDGVLEEARDCVKVMMSPGPPLEFNNRAGIDAMHNNHKVQIPRVPSDKQLVQIVPSLTERKPSQFQTNEDLDSNGRKKKKTKPWTKEEEDDLLAYVDKHGENWAEIQAAFNNRTAAQLSQRYSTIRKRQTPVANNSWKPSAISEEKKAANAAINAAIKMPMFSSGTLMTSSHSTVPASSRFLEARPPAAAQPAVIPQKVLKTTVGRPRKTAPKKRGAAVAPTVNQSSMIQAAAFAAGGRIAEPSTAASLIKAAQSKSAVHIRLTGGFPKSLPSCKTPNPSLGTQAAFSQYVESSSIATENSLVKQKGQQLDGCSKFAGVDCSTNSTSAHDLESHKRACVPSVSSTCDDGQETDVGALVLDELLKEESSSVVVIEDLDDPEEDHYTPSLAGADKVPCKKDASQLKLIKERPAGKSAELPGSA